MGLLFYNDLFFSDWPIYHSVAVFKCNAVAFWWSNCMKSQVLCKLHGKWLSCNFVKWECLGVCFYFSLFFFFKVGIILHYSTLATVLWLGVTSRNIYKQVTKKAKRCQDPDEPPPPPRPMLRWASCLFLQLCVLGHLAHILTRNFNRLILFFCKCFSYKIFPFKFTELFPDFSAPR